MNAEIAEEIKKGTRRKALVTAKSAKGSKEGRRRGCLAG